MNTLPLGLTVERIPAFTDNYLWLIHDGRHAVVVDPGDAAPIVAALASHNLELRAIFLTHHHADHCGGVAELLRLHDVPVFGPSRDGITGLTRALQGGETVELSAPSLVWRVIDVPGHTRGHIAFYDTADGRVFCGDTLFAGGCGRLFEGSPAQMHASLTTLAALPDATLVYCAHEYTESNLKFAMEAEPQNAALKARVEEVAARRARGEATVPSTLALEKATNPFLRCDQSAIAERLRQNGALQNGSDPVDVFAALREWKNNYR